MNTMNKKGSTLSGWSEVALFVVLFLSVLGIIIVNFNALYDKNEDPTFGFNPNSTLSNYTAYQDSIQAGTNEGQVEVGIFGFSLSTTWTMIKAGLDVTWSFVTGAWLENAVALVRLPPVVGVILRLLFILSIGFIIIKLIMKVRP